MIVIGMQFVCFWQRRLGLHWRRIEYPVLRGAPWSSTNSNIV
jgi:hypothetical protein